MRGCRGQIDDQAGEVRWELTFGDLESDATQSHIHFENSTSSGPVVVFLCTNLGNSPVPVQAPSSPRPRNTASRS